MVVDWLFWQVVQQHEVVRLPPWVLSAILTASGRTGSYVLVEVVTLVHVTALASKFGTCALLG